VHELESLYSQSLHHERQLSREAIDLIFDCLDTLAAGLEQGREDLSRLRVMVSELTLLTQTPTPKKRHVQSFPFAVTEIEYAHLLQAQHENQTPYVIEKAIRTDLSEEAFNRLPILEDIAPIGEVVAIRPRYSELNRDEDEAILRIAFVSRLPRDELELIVFDPFEACGWPVEVNQQIATAPQNSDERQAVQPTETRRRILITEDEPTSRILLCELLKPYGDCHVACNGKEAVTLVKHGLEQGKNYDLICLDVMMPEMDGYDALHMIRELETTLPLTPRNRTKIIMTTALSSYEHFHRAFVNDCDSYLVKPITKAALERQLLRLCVKKGDNCVAR
jgi:two-component system chemotaxis response regulator CheY